MNTTEKEIKLATRWGWRRPSVKRTAGVLRRLRAATSAAVRIAFDAKNPTACWKFEAGIHHITVGDYAAGMMSLKARCKPAAIVACGKALLRHEAGHGFFTERDFGKTRSELTAAGIPFVLLNIFEDARIESLLRAQIGTEGKFNWTRWDDKVKQTTLPLELFSSLTNTEAECYPRPLSHAARWTGATKTTVGGSQKNTASLILDFHTRARAAATTLDLVPIIVEWVALFGKPTGGERSGGRADGYIGGVTDSSEVRGTGAGGGSSKADTATRYEDYVPSGAGGGGSTQVSIERFQ